MISPPLATKADHLTELLREVEDELFSKGLLVQAEVVANKGKIRWAKRGANWTLFWVDEADSAHELTRSSLGRRAASVEHLPALEQAIWAAMLSRDSVVDEAISKAAEYLKKLRAVPLASNPKEGT